MSNNVSSVSNIYKLDGYVPVVKAIPFGLQHVLAMFVSNLAPISIIAATGEIGLWHIFPEMIQNVFSVNVVAVVFVASIILNIILPKNMEVERINE